jgi:hypothetical protein
MFAMVDCACRMFFRFGQLSTRAIKPNTSMIVRIGMEVGSAGFEPAIYAV